MVDTLRVLWLWECEATVAKFHYCVAYGYPQTRTLGRVYQSKAQWRRASAILAMTSGVETNAYVGQSGWRSGLAGGTRVGSQ